jgi:hypothetical protein
MKLVESFNRRIYDIRDRFGIHGYRGNRIPVEKIGMATWLTISMVGKLLCMAWAVLAFSGKQVSLGEWRLVLVGLLMWGFGDFYASACHRGILYHHMDLLADYLDSRIKDEKKPTNPSATTDT